MKGKNQTILGVSLAALLALLCSVSVVAAPAHSPNGRIGLQPHANGFDVLYQGRQVLTIADVGVSLSTDDKRRPASLSLVASGEGHRVDVDYTMLAGKRLHCTNQYNEYRYTFRDAEGQEQVLVMRLCNDGIAFRYELENLPPCRFSSEQTALRAGDASRQTDGAIPPCSTSQTIGMDRRCMPSSVSRTLNRDRVHRVSIAKANSIVSFPIRTKLKSAGLGIRRGV